MSPQADLCTISFMSLTGSLYHLSMTLQDCDHLPPGPLYHLPPCPSQQDLVPSPSMSHLPPCTISPLMSLQDPCTISPPCPQEDPCTISLHVPAGPCTISLHVPAGPCTISLHVPKQGPPCPSMSPDPCTISLHVPKQDLLYHLPPCPCRSLYHSLHVPSPSMSLSRDLVPSPSMSLRDLCTISLHVPAGQDLVPSPSMSLQDLVPSISMSLKQDLCTISLHVPAGPCTISLHVPKRDLVPSPSPRCTISLQSLQTLYHLPPCPQEDLVPSPFMSQQDSCTIYHPCPLKRTLYHLSSPFMSPAGPCTISFMSHVPHVHLSRTLYHLPSCPLKQDLVPSPFMSHLCTSMSQEDLYHHLLHVPAGPSSPLMS
ncbi:vegetative cell wall protein gp1-like [Haliotis rubra]|uniref:vegetative cell wall protein gp1-like n=1 Tax=Haliotis rubra TaxID=36100 RepID=UPI001EE61829|nr:vegetative cell wall protein gp1-like [Haliotis rubra]